VKRFLFGLLICSTPAWAMLNAEVKEGAVSPDGIAHVETGAVQVTGTINSDVKPGAVQATVQPGAISSTATFNKSLIAAEAGACKIEAPMTVKEGAIQLTLYPRAFSLNVEDGAVQVQPGAVVIKADFGPLASKMAEVIKPAQDAAASVESVIGHWRLIAEGIGGLSLALAVGWYFSHHGQKKMIAQLKEQNG
jgi:hypothetical protein